MTIDKERPLPPATLQDFIEAYDSSEAYHAQVGTKFHIAALEAMVVALNAENAALEKREQQALQAASVEAKLFDEERQKNAALAAEVERLRKDAGRVDAYIKFMRDNAFNPELHAHETRDLLETCKRLEEWRSGIND